MSGQHPQRWRNRANTRAIAPALRSTSCSDVCQLDTDTRIAAMPCQTVPPSQQVPSFCTPVMTARVDAKSSYRWMPIEAARAALPTVFAKALDRASAPDLFG